MVREVLSISVGQCGIQMGDIVWRNYCAEHEIDEQGHYARQNEIQYRKHGPTKYIIPDYEPFGCFFEQTGSGQYVLRSLMVDLEPNVIDDIKTSKLAEIFDPEFLLAGKEDAANNFARGHFTVGKEIIDKVNDKLRKLVDNCDNVQGFIMSHGVGGGTGSGLAMLILERLSVDYRKKSKLTFSVYPSIAYSTNVVAPYNALLSSHWMLDHTELTAVLDNEAGYELCQRRLEIKAPTYDDVNRLFAKPISSITCGLRFEGELNVDLNEFQTGLVPFPRLHFHTCSIAPIYNREKKHTTRCDIQGISEWAFDPSSFLVKIPDFDAEEDKYMAVALQYRGDVKAKEANATVQWLKCNRKCVFVEWCPTGFKVGLNDEPHKILNGDTLAGFKRNVVMNSNNTVMGRVLSQRITQKYDLMYSQRAFVHWYVGEGMEEGEFAEARKDLGFLEKDYMDVLSEQATDDWTDEDIDEDC